MKRTPRLILVCVLVSLGMLAAWGMRAASTSARQADPLTQALQRARAAGSYSFTSDITQITVPVAKIANVGRTSRTDQVHAEGQANLRDRSMVMRLWSGQGSVADRASGAAIKVENDKSYVQDALGGWREREGLTEGFAPEGDFMSFLAALREPVAQPPETRNGIAFTRYTFRLDGPALATYLRDQTEAALRARGELPPGFSTQVPAYYRDMVGDGELWVGSDGLPLRQILRMRFPEQRDEIVQAEIVTNFSGFGPVGSAAAGLGDWLAAPPAGRLADLLPALVVSATIAGSMLLLRQGRRVWRGLSAAVIVALVVGPLAGNLQVARASAALAARATSREQQQTESRQREDLLARLAGPQFDPHANPLAAANPAAALSTGAPAAAIGPAGAHRLAASAPLATLPAAPSADGDNDGLTDVQEAWVGTDPTWADTDGDGISDGVEVKGFPAASPVWFMNANKADSNGDTLPDTVEYDFDGNGAPDDTDHDSIPDVFDDDNDGDGVPDGKDLAPFEVVETSFTEAAPLALSVNGLTPGRPTFLDFQIRPVDERHLWFAHHVLDWPRDVLGQVQDLDGQTFAGLARELGDPAPAPGDDNGDMKLVPMLEIRVPESGSNLPPETDLAAYGISVTDMNADHSVKLLYVPLTVVSDEKTGARVAFNARMRYLPTGTWPSAHQVRLVWLVQMLNDIPCDPSAPGATEQGCRYDGRFYIFNLRSVVQSYYEEWKLTGLNVMEDHGASVAIVFEDPQEDPSDPNLVQDEVLATLAAGLDQAFLGGRDSVADGLDARDVDIAELERRFKHGTTATLAERWGLPDRLIVDRKDYAASDQATAFTAMTETVSILNSHFAGRWMADPEIRPLLLYAQEARSRGLGMDALAAANGSVTFSGSVMRLDLAVQDAPAPLVVTANLSWMPYCAPAGATARWAPCDMALWWQTLEARNPNAVPGDPGDPSIAAGRTLAMNIYSSILMQGVSRVVEQDGKPMNVGDQLEGDDALLSKTQAWFASGADVFKLVANKVLMARYYQGSTFEILRYLGDTYKGMKTGIGNTLESAGRILVGSQNVRVNRAVGTALVMTGALAIGAATWILADAFGDKFWNAAGITFDAAIIAFTAYTGVIKPAVTVVDWMRAAKQANVVIHLGSLSTEFLETSRTAGVIGAVLEVGIVWGFFLFSMAANGVSAFSPAWNGAMAEVIASTIYIVMLAMLAATVIGLIIVAIIELFDLILTFICKLGGDALKDVPGMEGACFTIGGAVTKYLLSLLYTFGVMVDTSGPDLVVLGPPVVSRADETKGFVVGNALSVSMPITTNIVHKPPAPRDMRFMWPYLWFYSPDNLRTTTFKYSLTSPARGYISARRGEMSSAWTVTPDRKYGPVTMYRGQARSTPTTPGMTLPVGLDRWEGYFHINLGYALPAYECWGIPIFWFASIPICYVRTLKGNDSTLFDELKFDIFPASLDDFTNLAARGQGLALAWDGSFAPLKDADGDGLRPASQHGLDPDDSSWDADGDGLSDAYELKQRADGVGYSPLDCDTDNDGLTDKQEARFGTAPDHVDTDGDGLTDAQEVVHRKYLKVNSKSCVPQTTSEGGWRVSVNTTDALDIIVESNPVLPDTDADGVPDKEEHDLALAADPTWRVDLEGRPYHPNVPNVPLLTVHPQASPDMLRPGQSLTYTTTAITRRALEASAPLTLTLPPALDGSPLTGALPFDPLSFTGTQTVTHQATLHARADAVTQVAIITSTVQGRLAGDGWAAPRPGTATIRIDRTPPTSRVDSLTDGQYVDGDASHPVITVIGGSASDALSGSAQTGIARVEVSVNDGEWQPAEGTSSWAFPLSVTEGAYSIRTRATDGVGNLEIPGQAIMVIADGRPPEFNFVGQPAGAVVPARLESGRWTVSLGGIVFDPTVGGSQDPAIYDGSGVDQASIQVRLLSSDRPVPVTGEWQLVTLAGDQWTIDYEFAQDVSDATGVWRTEMRATDKVGNTRQELKAPPPLYVDSRPPGVGLHAQDTARIAITGTASVGGVISDTLSAVKQLDVSFAPLDQVTLFGDAAMWLQFEEPANAAYWADRSGNGNAARCIPTQPYPACPTTAQPGVSGGGLDLLWSWEGGYAFVRDAPELNLAAGAGFSLQTWVKANNYDYGAGLVTKRGAYELGRGWGGEAAWVVFLEDEWTDVRLQGGTLSGDTWHQVVGTFDPTGKIQLFVDGELVDSGVVPLERMHASSALLGFGGGGSAFYYNFSGMLDEVAVFKHALSPAEAKALYRAGLRQWYPAALPQAGAGITQTTWSLAVPAGLEGLYQIDLRGWDALDNHQVTANVWRGTIDTLAPRLGLTANPAGSVYIDPGTGERRVSARYTCAAQDMFLDEGAFRCPGSNLPPPVRSFEEDPILRGLFPDLTLRSGLVITWTQWERGGVPVTRTVQACDVLGNCATQSREVTVDLVPAPDPAAAVVAPASGATIGSNGTVNVAVAANASQSLQNVWLQLDDGDFVNIASFGQYDAVKTDRRDVTLTVEEGQHRLVALASDWAGHTQSQRFPVTFTLDAHPPTVTISTTLITENEVFQKGSGMLRFRGAASDTLCLAAVQLRVGDSPFADTTFGGGEWAVAYFVNGPEGQTLAVTARATDCAGQVSEASATIGTDLSGPDAPDTEITSVPEEPNPAGGATFAFRATGQPAAGIMCQVDNGLYDWCTSPLTLAGLTGGPHILRVRAVGMEGSVDETPATHTWTVAWWGYRLWLPLVRGASAPAP